MIPGQTSWQTAQIDTILVIVDHHKEKKETERKVRDRKKRNGPKEKKRKEKIGANERGRD